MHLKNCPRRRGAPPDGDTLLQRQVAFGYTFEDERLLLDPMARSGVEAVGSMGNDTPLAVLSASRTALRLLQAALRAGDQPADRLHPREIVTSSEVWLGSEGNLLKPHPSDCRRLELSGPILSNEDFAKIRRLEGVPGLKVGVLSTLFRVTRGDRGLVKSLEELRLMARRMIEEEEINILILSDRGVNREFAPIPALLAISALHHYLIREGLRLKVSLVLETGEAREVHHFALLVGYGASAVNPYLAFESIDGMIRDELLTGVDHKGACKNFVKAATKGVVKVMSRWASRRCRVTTARRCSRPSGYARMSSTNTSPARPRASAAWRSR